MVDSFHQHVLGVEEESYLARPDVLTGTHLPDILVSLDLPAHSHIKAGYLLFLATKHVVHDLQNEWFFEHSVHQSLEHNNLSLHSPHHSHNFKINDGADSELRDQGVDDP